MGFFGGFFQTVKLALFDPARLFGRMRVDNAHGAFLFGWLCLTIGALAANFWGFVTGSLGPQPATDVDLDALPPELGEILEKLIDQSVGVESIFVSTILTPISAAIALLLWAAMVHLGALLFGAAGRGWNATFRAVCFSFAPMLAGIIPFCGYIIGFLWSIVLTIAGVYYLQRTTAFKASGAVLIWYVFCCCCCCVATFALASMAAEAFRAMGMG